MAKSYHRCTRCNIDLAESEFKVDRVRPTGRYPVCNYCLSLERHSRTTAARDRLLLAEENGSAGQRTCSTCGGEFPATLSNFYLDSTRSDGLKTSCKRCYVAKTSARAARTRDKQAEYNRTSDARQRQWFSSLKAGKPCADCGLTYEPWVMDWDHVRGEKVGNVSLLMNRSQGRQKVLVEIDKCELVCANCHRSRTYRRWLAGESEASA